MRKMIIAGLLGILFSPLANAGSFIYQNMWSQHNMIQGKGNTMQAAMADAVSAKPITYILDPGNSWEVWEMRKSDWMATRPVVQSEFESFNKPFQHK